MTETAAQATRTISLESEGAVVIASAPRSCTSGRPIPLSIAIRNTGTKPFFCDEDGYFPDCRIEMELERRDSGAHAQMTKFGKNFFEMAGEGHSQGALTEVHPGGERSWSVDLAEFFAIAPGRYVLRGKLLLYRDEYAHSFEAPISGLEINVSD